MEQTDTRRERQQARRDARREANRTEILDAAERVFARDGLHHASMRAIATEAGFSTAAIYLFFESRQHLLAEALTRRGDELNDVIESVVRASPDPLTALHRVIDATLTFFGDRADFRRMLIELRGGRAIIGPALADYARDVDDRMNRAQGILAGAVAAAQREGAVRGGDPHALAQIYMVLVNEYVHLCAESDLELSAPDFHALVDGALRAPGS